MCSSCGAEVPTGARFCPGCGQDQRLRGDERRVVTVLFADLVGFTALAEVRDPEHVKNLVDRCFQRLVTDIEAFGGRVDKIVGDAIVALFGAPVAHEDDAERAVRAALAMQGTLERESAEVGVVVRMRIGVNTGEVLVGALRAGGDYTAMGDVVNTASRLQTRAEPGQVLVGPATHAATRRVIDYEPTGEFVARGREEPVGAWVARAALLPPGHRPDRDRAELVGRDAELAVLERSVDVALHHRRALLALVLGEAGVGKSRLAEELAARAESEHDALVLEGRCVPYGEANVWWPVADALRHGCDVRSTDPDDVAVDRTRAAVSAALGDQAPAEEVDRILAGLLHLMGIGSPLRGIDPARAREAATTALITFAHRVTEHRPVVVVLSDLHWADDLVLEVVDALVERLANRRFVLLATARRTLDDRWSPPVGRHNQVRLTLDPLGDEAAAAMLRSLLGSDPGAELTAALLDRAGGNPFFLEELVTLVTEAGVAGGSPAASGHPALATAHELPDTLRGLVTARLDGLGAQERRVLECCAILGRKGPVSAITTMASYYLPAEVVTPTLDSLVAKELLVVTGSDSSARWSFRSDLVREVAYGTLTKGDRARGHAGIAAWMEHHEDLEREANLDRVTHHWTRAAEVVAELGHVEGVPDQAIDRALAWIGRAAARADGSDVPLVAARLYGDGLALLTTVGSGTADPLRPAFLLGRARALVDLHQLDDAHADAQAVLDEAAGSRDDALEGRALLVLAEVAQKRACWAEADALLERATSCFGSAGDAGGEAEALRLLGFGALFQADQARATELLEAARARFVSLGDRRGEAWALQNLAWCAFSTGHAEVAETRLRTAAAVFTEIGDVGGLGWARGLLAYTRFMQGHRGEAEELAESVRAEAQERGDRWGLGMMVVLTASVRLWTGRTCSAVEHAEQALAHFELLGDEFGRVQAAGVLGRSLVASGRVTDGLAVLADLVGVTDLTTATAADADGAGPDAPDPEAGDPAPAELSAVGRSGMGRIAELGAAVHLGDVTLGANALGALPDLERLACGGEPSTIEGEQATSVALHLLQRGDVAGAARVLDALPAPTSPLGRSASYTGAVRALVHAAGGDRAEALGASTAVVDDPVSTYLDVVMALLAAAGAHAAGGDRAAALGAAARAAEVAGATEDRAAAALAELGQAVVAAALDGASAGGPPAADGTDGAPLAGAGWHTALRLVAGYGAGSDAPTATV